MPKYVAFKSILKIGIGCIFFSLGFNLFLRPNGLNAGGISGLSMVIVSAAKFGTVGILTGVINIPLFAVAGIRIGRRFFALSVVGMLISSMLIDLTATLPMVNTEPLVGALYGGVLCGIGTGIIYTSGGSTGGSDIIVRLVKMHWHDIPIGLIVTGFDLLVASLTGLVFRDINRMLYSTVAIVISGQIIDAVVYRFDYSRVALIISRKHEQIANAVGQRLSRGATFLRGEGSYTHNEIRVILTAVKRQQLTELKRLVAETDPDAFVIVQEAHQVLGDGFSRFSRDNL